MNAQEFSPDSNSAGKLNKNQTIGCFLFVTDQQFTKTAEKKCVTSTTQRRAQKSGLRSSSFFSLIRWVLSNGFQG
jgi:hypothetical protein